VKAVERRTGPLTAPPSSTRVASGAAPTLLVAGVVRHIHRLRQLGQVESAGTSLLAPRAFQSAADLIIVGCPPGGTDEAAVIARLKDDPATAAVPILHAGDEVCAGGCGADFCLSAGSTAGQLARVAEALLDLARARARRSGLVAARAALEARPAAPPAA
jgi:hypothetical protein